MNATAMIEYVTSPALSPIRHGFFTRKGGASSGIFEGLNCGRGSSDMAEMVEINRQRVAEAMDAPPEALISLDQVHSADVAILTAVPTTRPRADAMVTTVPGLVLGILTADCQPVLFADAEAGVIGAAHAGWKGAIGGVLEATVEAMIAQGARRAAIHAVIGPTISQAAYEVSPEFRDTFLAKDPTLARFFAQGREGKFQFDLPGFGLERLRSTGIGSASWTGHCTYGDESRFYSYRRTCHRGEADYGRLISTIRL